MNINKIILTEKINQLILEKKNFRIVKDYKSQTIVMGLKSYINPFPKKVITSFKNGKVIEYSFLETQKNNERRFQRQLIKNKNNNLKQKQ